MDFRTEISVNASAADAWEVVGSQFGDIASWTETLSGSSLDRPLGPGATRTCTSSSGFGPFPAGTVDEQLNAFDADRMTLTYVARTGLPRMVRGAENTWSVREISDDRCVVTTAAQVELAWWARPLGPVMRAMTRRPMGDLADELVHRIETGS